MKHNLTRFWHLAVRFSKAFFGTLGVLLFIAVLLSFTDLPYYAYDRLGTSGGSLPSNPDLIVVLGGAGMPSPDGLIRCYYASEAALKYPKAKVIIALPANETDSLHQLDMAAHELIVHGVDSLRISYEPLGFNTHSQALNIADNWSAFLNKGGVLIVTSPEHMYRAVRTFRKAGFARVGGLPTFEKPPDAEKIKDKEKSSDPRVKSLALRYNMWSYLNYELIVMREYTAILYYRAKSWI
jgi:uncharacterized SAM-binding protein YcdF (DUF218 family)